MNDPETEAIRAVYEPLTQSVRSLIEAAIRTEVHPDAIAAAHAHLQQADALLRSHLMPSSFAMRTTDDGQPAVWGNVAIGLRNPIAPPLIVTPDGEGRVRADFELGAPYEGPPGHVHGGVCALILDHILGAPVHRTGEPAFTGTLTMRYVRPTRLGRLHAAAWIDREEGVKTFTIGHLADNDGPTVEAHGVFIRPRRTSASI